MPGAPTETFGYNPDGTLRTATTRVTTTGQIDGNPLEVEYAYDAANRVLGVRISNPDEFTTTADSVIVDDAGDAVTLDALGRPTVRGRRLADGSLEPRSKVTWAGYDKRGLPASESVGAWGEGLTLGRQYDVLGRRTALELPAGLGGPATDLVWTFEFECQAQRKRDCISVPRRLQCPPALADSWVST